MTKSMNKSRWKSGDGTKQEDTIFALPLLQRRGKEQKRKKQKEARVTKEKERQAKARQAKMVQKEDATNVAETIM